MWRDLLAFRARTGRPVVACLMDLACGGAYHLATACDLVVAHPTTVTGGIGVILNLFNFQGTLNLAKVENLSVKAKDSPKIDLDYRIGVLNEDDKERLIEASAMPIVATGGQRGAMVFFWPAEAADDPS
jgi:protease-4